MRVQLRTMAWGIVSIGLALSLLAACASSDSSSSSGSSSPQTVASATGAGVALAGTWIRDCRQVDGFDQQETSVFDGATITATEVAYSTTDLSCLTVNQTGTSTNNYTFAVQFDATMTAGWSDGSSAGQTQAAQGGGNLPATPTASVVMITASGGAFYGAYFVDDTGSPQRLYQETSEPSACNYDDSAAPPVCLSQSGYTKQ